MRRTLHLLALLVACLMIDESAPATVVIINFTKDRIVVAADSLSLNITTGDRDYSYCKIAAFQGQVLFTSVGGLRFTDTNSKSVVWDNLPMAREAARAASNNGRGNIDVQTAVINWANAVKRRFEGIPMPELREAFRANGGQLTAGAFIGPQLSFRAATVGFVENPANPIHYQIFDELATCWPCGQETGEKICAAGRHFDVAEKFCSQRKHGAKISIRARLHKGSKAAKLAAKIVELIIDAHGETAKDVGGSIDVVTISKDGRITWNARKPICSEDQE